MIRKSNKGRSFATGKSSSSRKSKSTRSAWGKSFRSASAGKSTGGASGKGTTCARGYGNINSTFETKVKCFRMLCDQTRGPAKGTRPSPAHLKTFANWVNKGANICKVTNTQLNKWCKTNQSIKSTTSAKNVLCKKFGKSTIKAVAPCKSGGFIVATAATVRGKSFNFPK